MLTADLVNARRKGNELRLVKLDDEGEWKRINAEKVAAARAAATPGGAQP